MRARQILKNESGMAFLMIVIIVAVIITGLGYLAATSTAVTAARRGGVREELAAEIVLENFAVLAKQAYEVSQYAGGFDNVAHAYVNPCPAGTTTKYIAGPLVPGRENVRLCVKGTPETSCVQDPRMDSNGTSMICASALQANAHIDERIRQTGAVAFSGFGTLAELAQIERTSYQNRLPSSVEIRKKFSSLLTGPLSFESVAQAAQRQDLPTSTAIFTTGNTIAPIVSGDPNYIRCNRSSPTDPSFVVCGSISVCMAMSLTGISTCDPKKKQTYTQIIGFSAQ